MIFLMPIIVLIAIQQLKSMVEHEALSDKNRRYNLIIIFVLHFIFFLLLWKAGNIILTSYLTVLGSWIFFTIHSLGLFVNRKVYFMGGLLCLAFMQPVQFFSFYSKNASGYTCDIPSENVVPKFSYQRPAEDFVGECRLFRHVPDYVKIWHMMMMEDSSGKIRFTANLSRWSFLLHMMLDADVFEDYTENKFILYDDVAFLDETDLDKSLRTLENTLKANTNLVYISDRDDGLLDQTKSKLSRRGDPPLIVRKNNAQVRVLDFDVNSLKLKTNFDVPKFLVYTDSFNSHWKVFIDDQEEKIYRTNLAFKGVYLPAGQNNVYFKYSPPGGTGVYYFIIVFFLFFFIYLIFTIKNQYKKLL